VPASSTASAAAARMRCFAPINRRLADAEHPLRARRPTHLFGDSLQNMAVGHDGAGADEKASADILARTVDVHGENSMRLHAIMVVATLVMVSANADELTRTLQKIKETNRVVLAISRSLGTFQLSGRGPEGDWIRR
jgi:hypothetical protein